jgi:phage shock protein A
MALMERVATLIRANLNDLIEQAEDPDKTLKQVMLDMQNQLMQVKTQVAIAIADQHVLAKKKAGQEEQAQEWDRKAELAVSKEEDDLARAAIERSLTCRAAAESCSQQAEQQSLQVENLKSALRKLEEKFSEAQLKHELLAAEHRRARALQRTADAELAVNSVGSDLTFDRLKQKVSLTAALGEAQTELINGNVDERIASLDKRDKVERLLEQLKSRRG